MSVTGRARGDGADVAGGRLRPVGSHRLAHTVAVAQPQADGVGGPVEGGVERVGRALGGRVGDPQQDEVTGVCGEQARRGGIALGQIAEGGGHRPRGVEQRCPGDGDARGQGHAGPDGRRAQLRPGVGAGGDDAPDVPARAAGLIALEQVGVMAHTEDVLVGVLPAVAGDRGEDARGRGESRVLVGREERPESRCGERRCGGLPEARDQLPGAAVELLGDGGGVSGGRCRPRRAEAREGGRRDGGSPRRDAARRACERGRPGH